MSADQITAAVGDVLPQCDLPLRADGTVLQAGYFIDPVRMHLVVGADVNPWHERAITQACQADADAKRLWVWQISPYQDTASIGLSLWLRPDGLRLPPVQWQITYDPKQFCDSCGRDTAIRALATHDVLSCDHSRGLASDIVIVGRDHKVLGISQPACHGLISLMWQEKLMNVGPMRAGDCELPAVLHHASGQPDPMDAQDLERYLVADGWAEPASDRRLRHKKQRASRRAQP